MALKGLDIFKLSPKKNCKECGNPTCMAFCMKVAQGSVSIDKCPYFSEEAKAMLNESTAPAMKTITVGDHKLGGETVLFRHEKTLVNKNLFAVCVCTGCDEEKVEKKLSDLQKIDYERIGERMYVESVYVANKQDDPAVYAELVKKAATTGRMLILSCWDVACAKAALEVAGKNCILDGATPDNWEAMSDLATAAGVPLGVWASNISDLYDTVKKLEAKGNKNLVLDVTADTPKETLKNAVLVRRTAIKDGDRSFGYPSIVNVAKLAHGNAALQTAYASMFVEKYGSIIVMEEMSYAQALPLYGLRQNIFTDPQKPMKVEAKIYPINGADENSPCVLTVDFALTYFLVAGELERSGQPVNLIVTDASGMSVLTAWAAGKLSASSIQKTLADLDVAGKIRNRTLIIPGKVAVLKGEIQEKLPDWNVVVGPQEAVQLPKYMREKEYEAAAAAARAQREAGMASAGGEDRELTFEELLEKKVPKIEIVDMGVAYKARNPEAKTFVTIGERIHCIAPVIRKAMDERDPKPILERAAAQIKAGATYLDVNIGPAEKDGPERMMWAVKLLQENFNNVPLALDTANKKAIEAGIKVYNRTNGKPIVNSADAGSRIEVIDLAAANDAICIALCSADGIAKDNEERMIHCDHMLERGMALGMASDDLWFDPLFLVVKGMQDKQMEVLEAIKMFSDKGLKSTGGLSNNSNGAPKEVRPIMDSALIAMCMMQGLTSAIVNPNDRRLMETIKSCDIFKNNVLYSDSYLDI